MNGPKVVRLLAKAVRRALRRGADQASPIRQDPVRDEALRQLAELELTPGQWEGLVRLAVACRVSPVVPTATLAKAFSLLAERGGDTDEKVRLAAARRQRSRREARSRAFSPEYLDRVGCSPRCSGPAETTSEDPEEALRSAAHLESSK